MNKFMRRVMQNLKDQGRLFCKPIISILSHGLGVAVARKIQLLALCSNSPGIL